MAILGKTPAYRRLTLVFAFAGLFGLVARENAMQDTEQHELEVAFIYNFAKFVEWPPNTFPNAAAPFTICTVGNNPVVDGLRGLNGKLAQERSVRIQTILLPADALACQILFLGEDQDARFHDFFNAARGRSVLTVGDTDRFVEGGGIIGFFLENRKVRFAINLEGARKSSLTVSSKLIAVARVVQVR